jgi:hypothetical protein
MGQEVANMPLGIAGLAANERPALVIEPGFTLEPEYSDCAEFSVDIVGE